MAEEVDIIQHLIEVERDASQLLLEAQAQADKKISEARFKAESLFKEKYSVITKDLENRTSAAKENIDKEREAIMQQYKAKIADSSKNQESFNALCERFLFA